MEFPERAARNEEIFREVNERIADGAERHGVETPLSIHCECSSRTCLQMIEIAPPDYERIRGSRYRFVVLPGHEDPTIETVAERHAAFVVVEKQGEARKQIDRDSDAGS